MHRSLMISQALTPAYSADDVLSPYVYVFYASWLVAFVFTPVMRRIATYYDIIDRPDNQRKMHRTPVAYLGGVAVFLGWIAGLAVSQFVNMHRAAPGLGLNVVVPASIVISGTIVVVLGLFDDIFKISPWAKIAGQVVAAVLLLLDGVGRYAMLPVLRPITTRTAIWFGWPEGGMPPEWLVISTSCALVTAIIVFCCNATNLMDGLDGLCGGVTAIVAAGYTFLAINLAMWGDGAGANGDALRVVLAMALLGAVLAFVPFNFNPASIFMGDTGSMFLGFTCGLMIILLAEVHSRWLLAALVMFSLPILDTSLAFARRYVNKRPFFSADKHHLHHQLVGRGFSVKQAVVLSYALAVGFVILGAVIVFIRTRYAVGAYLVIFGSIIVAAYKMGMVHERQVVSKPRPLDEAGGPIRIAPENVLEVRDESAWLVGGASNGATTPPGVWTSSGKSENVTDSA